VSITGTEEETKEMLVELQRFADEQKIIVGVEYNASCPNIKGAPFPVSSAARRTDLFSPFPGHPPPAYLEPSLLSYFQLLAAHASPTLKVGMKLPPYTYDGQFDIVIRSLEAVKSTQNGSKDHPISFLTACNTLGQGPPLYVLPSPSGTDSASLLCQGLVFGEQIVEVSSSSVAQKAKSDIFALPGGFGGLAGAATHQIALGYVPSFHFVLLLLTLPT
jgi:dihydroorotate dehydrogenase (fumarate)